MIETIEIIGVLLAIFLSFILGRITRNSDLYLFERREYFDKLLESYINEAYESIYSKHILPFIANNVTLDLDAKDKFFTSISKIFLDVLNLKLGTMTEKVYYPIFGSRESFTDYVLLKLSLKLQEDVVDMVLRRNINSAQNQEQNSEVGE